jgi:lysophospholipase L1-like esterase
MAGLLTDINRISRGVPAMKCPRFLRCVTTWAVLAATIVAVAAARDDKPQWTITPVPRSDAWWKQRHEGMNARVKKGNVDLIMIGDSITHSWEGAGKDVWKKYYGKRNAVNLGIGGDGFEHVLWRLDHGNIEGISPKLAVLMIGTNNAANPAEKIAEGIKLIVEKLRAKLPRTKVLVLAIFPREANSQGRFRQNLAKTNRIIAKLADNKMVFYLDIGPKFLESDGTLSKEIMPDLLHPNAKGYAIWAEAVEPTVAKLMGEKQHGR